MALGGNDACDCTLNCEGALNRTRREMIVYPLDFHRRAEQKWARRLKSEVSKSEIVSKADAERLLKLAIEATRPEVLSIEKPLNYLSRA
jgi:hypothetical protein